MYILIGHCRKAVLLVGIRIDYISAAHCVGVNINGICGVGNENGVSVAEDINDIAAVCLCAVVYTNFGKLQ